MCLTPVIGSTRSTNAEDGTTKEPPELFASDCFWPEAFSPVVWTPCPVVSVTVVGVTVDKGWGSERFFGEHRTWIERAFRAAQVNALFVRFVYSPREISLSTGSRSIIGPSFNSCNNSEDLSAPSSRSAPSSSSNSVSESSGNKYRVFEFSLTILLLSNCRFTHSIGVRETITPINT